MRRALGRDMHVRVLGGAEWQDGRVERIVGALQELTLRHEAELAVERSMRALRLLHGQTPAGLRCVDPDGRLLTVSDRWLAALGAPGMPQTVRISGSEAPLALLIDVVDQGGVLPAELLSRPFERGARVHHRCGRMSRGRGLFIARRAWRVQGGELRLLHGGLGGTLLRTALPQGRSG